MRVDTTTGYSSATRDMEAVPSRGDILHIAEFTFIVVRVEWRVEKVDKYPCLWLRPFIGDDPRLTEKPYPLIGFANPPRTEDVITADGDLARVICVEWFFNQSGGTPDSVVHHLEVLSEADPGMAAVTQSAKEFRTIYGQTEAAPA